MPRILVIEDEADMQFVLADNLGAEGFEVDTAATGQDGLAQALSGQYGLVLLDIMLPDVNGLEVCKRLRAAGAAVPVIMLTARGEEIDKVVGLEVGADDYVTKPFGMRELVARIRAALRRTEASAAAGPDRLRIGDAVVDFAAHSVTRAGRVENLTRYENDLLRYLAASRGRPVARERILADVWGKEAGSSSRSLDNYVARLRAKLEPDPARPQYLLTVHGSGYRLM